MGTFNLGSASVDQSPCLAEQLPYEWVSSSRNMIMANTSGRSESG